MLQLVLHCTLLSETHAPLQSAFPGVQEVMTHLPLVHATALAPVIFVQSFPHEPQFSGLLVVSTHSAAGSVGAHVVLPQQTVPLQVFEQLPPEQKRSAV